MSCHPGDDKPAPDDGEGAVEEIGRALAMGVVLPPTNRERRAGRKFSLNAAIPYRAQQEEWQPRRLVEALYRKAGLDPLWLVVRTEDAL